MDFLLTEVMVRSAVAQDAKAVLLFLNQVSDETENLTFSSSDIGLSVKQETKFLSQAAKDKTFIIAEYRGKIIGSAQLIIPTRERVKRTAVTGISLLKEYWGKGVSDMLMKHIIERAIDLELGKINLKVRTDNIRARKFYERYGFKKEGESSRMFFINELWISGTYYGKEL